jgi:hypothetical protein
MSSTLLHVPECELSKAITEHGVAEKSVIGCPTTGTKHSEIQHPETSRSVIGEIYIENGGKVTLQFQLPAYELEALRRNFEQGAEDRERVENLKKRNEKLQRKIDEGAEHHKTTEDLQTRNGELRTKVGDGLEYQKRIGGLEKRNEELRRKVEEGADYQKAAEDLHTRNEELRRKIEDGITYQARIKDLEKRNDELLIKIEDGAEYHERTEDLHKRNQEPQERNRELQSRAVDLEAKLVEYDTKNQKAEAEICAYKTKTAYLEWDVQGLRKSIYSLRPFEQVTDAEIGDRFEGICQSILMWIGKQLRQNSSKPMFLDGGNQHFAYFLKNDERTGTFIIQSLIHQCLQKEFFGEHVYLVGLPEEHVALVQFIQTSMATKKPFPAQPRGTFTSISGWRQEILTSLRSSSYR